MMTLYKHEWKQNLKSFIIWTLSIGGLCFFCILLYTSMKESMSEMADAFSDMGAFAAAFGMDRLSIATLEGFYATEIGTIHGLGGAVFAAMLGAVLLSKEEDGHTGEFLYTLPVARGKAVVTKLAAMVSIILVFEIVCAVWYMLGFLILGEDMNMKAFFLYHLMQLLLHLEIGCICFFLSSLSKRNKLGMGIGIAILLYGADMMCRIVPSIENLKYITPFYYANPTDIFIEVKINGVLALIGCMVLLLSALAAYVIYTKRDLAS